MKLDTSGLQPLFISRGYEEADGSFDPGFTGLLAWKVSLTVLHASGILSTLFRIVHRWWSRSMWWDDYASIVPLISEGLHCSILWMFKNQGPGPLSDKTFTFWLSTAAYLLLLWSSRVCLALSVARVIPEGKPTRKMAHILSVAFAIVGLAILSGRVAVCVPRTGASSPKASARCVMNSGLAIAGFTVDIIADLLLVACSLLSFWKVKLPRNQRRLILTVFSASTLTCVVAIIYILLVLSPLNRKPMGPIYMTMMPHIEAAVSVIVCNLSVVVTYLYRICRRIKRENRLHQIVRAMNSSTSTEASRSSLPSRYTPTSIISLSGNADLNPSVFAHGTSGGVLSTRTGTRLTFMPISNPSGYSGTEDGRSYLTGMTPPAAVDENSRDATSNGSLPLKVPDPEAPPPEDKAQLRPIQEEQSLNAHPLELQSHIDQSTPSTG